MNTASLPSTDPQCAPPTLVDAPVARAAADPALEAPLFADPDHAAVAESHRIGAHGSTWEKLRFVAQQAALIVTGDLDLKAYCGVRLANVLEPPQLPGKLARFRACAEGRELLRDRPRITWQDVVRLRELPAHTLGGAYARYAIAHRLNPEFVVPPPHLDEEEAYIFLRGGQTHDLWHFVVDLNTTPGGEGAIVAFMFAQLPGALLGVLSVSGILAGLADGPWGVPIALRQYWHGRQAAPLLTVYWERLWEVPLDEVRERLGVRRVETRLSIRPPAPVAAAA